MKSFIYALTELEELPAKVLLYNSGVKLAVEGADTLGDLRKLAERGWRSSAAAPASTSLTSQSSLVWAL